ncbi:MAG TPA: endonuclease/exonuclease/phosphatase family protein, partial [Phycisphaerales bacterium]|nr:endonuclease/exonuclease/phosphatase family protein [Phycisphaerales bacterium]
PNPSPHISSDHSQPAGAAQPSPAEPTLLKRAVSALGGASLLVCYLFLAVWVLAIVMTDRFLLSQYLYWFNPGLVLAGCFFLLWGWAFKRLTGKPKPARRAAVCAALAVVVMAGREYGLFRWVSHLADAGPPRGGAIRIVHWNMSQFDVAPGVNIGERLSASGTPDIALVSMQNNPRLWEQLVTAMKRTPDQTVTLANTGAEKVFSRFPVTATRPHYIALGGPDAPGVAAAPPFIRRTLAWLFRSLSIQNRSPDYIEPASIVGVTFDTTAELGRPLHAWFIDMPSNPLISRADLVRAVTARASELQKAGSLPAPDFIAGDFNIPLGSGSLKAFAPGYSAASGTAGLGRLASWPRPRQVLQIDHILVSPRWRVSDYELLDPGASEHMAQTVLLWPADTSPASGAPK